ncbi:R3H and coiled-coil domain-containing protein 1 isoform X2 [Ambystoma mexicanum]|uniref:R3H and coiled-coil domain-containing protein 1 isoform X2 n=1 Tax=Ambystoma mexicanum TaxID=8296 RepID=UPI0037E95A95
MPEQAADEAGKETNCSDLVMDHTLETGCKDRDLHKQVISGFDKDTNCEFPSQSTLEYKTQEADISRPMREDVGMEIHCKPLEIIEVALDGELNVEEITAQVGKAVVMTVNSKSMDVSKNALEEDATLTGVTGSMGELVRIEASYKALEISTPSIKGHPDDANISDPVDETMGMEDTSSALDLGTAVAEVGRNAEDISVEADCEASVEVLCKAQDPSSAVLEDRSNVVDMCDVMGGTVDTEGKCEGIPELSKVASDGKCKVLEMHSIVAETIGMEADCKGTSVHQTNITNENAACEIPNYIGGTLDKVVDPDTLRTNQTVLEVDSSAGDKTARITESISGTVDVEAMDINQSNLEGESKVFGTSDQNQVPLAIENKCSNHPDQCASQDKGDTSVGSRTLASGVEDCKAMIKEDPCLENMAMEPLHFPPQCVQDFGMSDSEMLFGHKDVKQCPDEDSKNIQKTEELNNDGIQNSAECQHVVVAPEVDMASMEPGDEKAVTAVTCCAPSTFVSAASAEVLQISDKQESRDDEDCIQQLLQEIKAHLIEKDISIEKLKFDYSGYEVTLAGKAKFTHIIEIYDFLPELNTEDIMEAFSEFPTSEFRLQWVDSTHALGLFSTEDAANKALAKTHPLLKFRALLEASSQSQQKAHQCIGERLTFL